ncbi:SOS response-associated peptidase [Aliiroseovarius sp. KMU-50]|uniref:Abasic site processing protein n=1 Tax=Aliiroseovarius salicola TaxID=3009082 RepID=A0ABT4W269_9RHOB|nr:SOS response-associated peptidase [Aliiroseovarius sp. KMU-50]MDA5093902.1 SOS response-associated peptidase [Aliiroseovarius sp. KMU-50]
MCGRLIAGDMTQAQMLAIIEGFLYPGQSVITETDAPPAATGFNVKPTQQVNILFPQGAGITASTARWWLVPPWFKGEAEEWKATTFNAKIETAFEKPTFRDAWKHGRCLVPAMGYYEWSGPKANRIPNFVHLETNHPIHLFAGLHSQMPDGRRTCTLLTRPALPEITDLHPRMPVLLSPDEAQGWLDHSAPDDEIRDGFGTHWEGRFRVQPVAKFGMKDNGPQLIEPLEEDEGATTTTTPPKDQGGQADLFDLN